MEKDLSQEWKELTTTEDNRRSVLETKETGNVSGSNSMAITISTNTSINFSSEVTYYQSTTIVEPNK